MESSFSLAPGANDYESLADIASLGSFKTDS